MTVHCRVVSDPNSWPTQSRSNKRSTFSHRLQPRKSNAAQHSLGESDQRPFSTCRLGLMAYLAYAAPFKGIPTVLTPNYTRPALEHSVRSSSRLAFRGVSILISMFAPNGAVAEHSADSIHSSSPLRRRRRHCRLNRFAFKQPASRTNNTAPLSRLDVFRFATNRFKCQRNDSAWLDFRRNSLTRPGWLGLSETSRLTCGASNGRSVADPVVSTARLWRIDCVSSSPTSHSRNCSQLLGTCHSTTTTTTTSVPLIERNSLNRSKLSRERTTEHNNGSPRLASSFPVLVVVFHCRLSIH